MRFMFALFGFMAIIYIGPIVMAAFSLAAIGFAGLCVVLIFAAIWVNIIEPMMEDAKNA